MKPDQLKKTVRDLIKEYPIASVATVDADKPRARYMSMDTDDDLNLVAITYTQSRKIAQIKENNNLCVLFGADPQEMTKPFVNIEATAEICLDMPTKYNFWQKTFGEFFTGPEDPNYAIIKISPVRIEYYGSYEQEPAVFYPGETISS